MSKKIYELYGSDQRVIDNLKRKIRGYEKMKKDITSQNRKVNNQNRKLQQENKKYKEVINKALKLNEKIINMREQGYSYEQYKPYLLRQQNILKEVEHE